MKNPPQMGHSLLLYHELKRRACHLHPQEDLVHGVLQGDDADGPLGDALCARYSGSDIGATVGTQDPSQLPQVPLALFEFLADGPETGPVRGHQVGSRVWRGWRCVAEGCCKCVIE